MNNKIVNFVLFILIILCTAFIVVISDGNKTYEENIASTDKNIVNTEKNVVTKSSININSNEMSNNYIQKDVKSNNTIDYKRYFYNQLNETSKSVYIQIINNINVLKSGDKTLSFDIDDENVETNFQSTWDALMLDNPQIFYIDTNNITLETKTEQRIFGEKRYSYKLNPRNGEKYFVSKWTNEQDVENDIKKVEQIANMVVSNAKGDRYNKIKYVHDYLVDNVEYDQSNGINSGSLYGALIEKKAVCEGYSKAFQYLLNLLNIPNIIVYGSGTNSQGNSEFHSWNYVQMDDEKWYAVDVTWDDPIVIGNGTIGEDVRTRYFLKGSDFFFQAHVESGDVSGTGQNFKYIEISNTDY